MDLDQLKGFYYTARLRSFTAAARRLHLSQPAVSLKVKALEDAVGERLLERVRRSIRLTPAGRIIYDLADDLLARFDDLERAVLDIKGLGQGSLAIGASDTTSLYLLPRLLKEFRAEHPGLEVRVATLSSRSVVEKVMEREVDLGLVTMPQSMPRLVSEPLFTHRFVCIAPCQHRVADLKSVSVADVTRESLVLLGPESITRHHIDAWLGQGVKRPDVRLEFGSFEIVKQYVAAGHGLSLVPERAVTPAPAGLVVVPLRHRLTVKVGTVIREDRTPSHAARAFLARARSELLEGASGASGTARGLPRGRPSPSRN